MQNTAIISIEKIGKRTADIKINANGVIFYGKIGKTLAERIINANKEDNYIPLFPEKKT